jgi:hypothetical protein
MPDNENVAPHLKDRVARIWAAAAARVVDFEPRNRANPPVARTTPAPESEVCPCSGQALQRFDESDSDELLQLLKMPAQGLSSATFIKRLMGAGTSPLAAANGPKALCLN